MNLDLVAGAPEQRGAGSGTEVPALYSAAARRAQHHLPAGRAGSSIGLRTGTRTRGKTMWIKRRLGPPNFSSSTARTIVTPLRQPPLALFQIQQISTLLSQGLARRGLGYVVMIR
jgi:hypothetical protein